MSKEIVRKWKKNRSEDYRIAFGEFKGRPQLSLRIWYQDSAGELKPGNVGINFGLDHFELVFDAMRHIERKLRRRGVLPERKVSRD